jgi:hypothetical protein
MPPSFEEMAHWTVDDINAQILLALPKGWKFDLQTHPDHWRAAYKTETGDEVWAEEHYALRILLMSAFGWLWQQKNPARVHPAWNPNPSRPLAPVRRSEPQHTIPDPEDLNPENIRAVYAEHARRRGKEFG